MTTPHVSRSRAQREQRVPMMGAEVSDGDYLDIWVPEPLVAQNPFLTAPPQQQDDAPGSFPALRWPDRPEVVSAWDTAWRLAAEHVRLPTPGTGFVSPFVDTAFNDCVFLWDSVFIAAFARYARAALPGQRTLDNLYAAQHPDGFITRELRQWDGADRFHRHDPSSTGPNLLSWSELDHFRATGDLDRLRSVWAPVTAYHRWTARHRSWPGGGMWTTGFGCGMDNIVRDPGGSRTVVHHAHLTWVDATAQQHLSAGALLEIAAELGVEDRHTAGLRAERAVLERVLDRCWDPDRGWYCDLDRHGRSTGIRTLAGVWPLLTGVVPPERQERIVASLRDERVFGGPVPVPALAADEPRYDRTGDYWNGGVWSPTTYATLRALHVAGERDLAHGLAMRHLDAVVRVHADTGTLWENYAPEGARPGRPAKPDFVGWTGLSVTAVLLEFGLGLSARPGQLEWDARLLDEVELGRYPVGSVPVDLAFAARRNADEPPSVTITTPEPLTLTIRDPWPTTVAVPAGTSTVTARRG